MSCFNWCRISTALKREGTNPFLFFLLVGWVVVHAGWPGLAHAESKKHIIKFSTLAPEGSTWMKEMRLLAKEVKQRTDGNLVFKFYPGGVSGDERDVIRKMRIGQLHGAGFTGVGLGEILPEVRVLDLPFLFDDDDQIRHVYEKTTDYFTTRFEQKGYILLGWVPVGWIHFFSVKEFHTADDLKKFKPWMWEGDPLVAEAYKALGVKPVPLSVTDVLMALQTGMVDTVYASPQGALALQWFTKVKHMSQIRMGYATGGVLISKRKFKSLPAEYQEVLTSVSNKYLAELVQKTQEENFRSIQVMTKNGVRLVNLPADSEIEKFHQAGAVARSRLAGKLFSQKLLDTVLSYLKEVR